MKLYNIEVVIADNEDMGDDKIRSLLENNGSIKLKIKRMESKVYMDWYDVHPMNRHPLTGPRQKLQLHK